MLEENPLTKRVRLSKPPAFILDLSYFDVTLNKQSNYLSNKMKDNSTNPSLAIGVVIKDGSGKILFVEEARNKYYEKTKGVLGIPSGKVDWTEDIQDGIKREVFEELNIKVKPVGLVGVYQIVRENSQCMGLAFLAERLEPQITIKINRSEIRSYKWLSCGHVLNMKNNLRVGTKEVLKDYQKNITIPIDQVHFLNFS
ncbi:MAG: NUDIX hydrolase [Candidatus Moranbacteria bacterium]|nr:NUDIX hydrolase [Candidatus Moranbacteria bacterium]